MIEILQREWVYLWYYFTVQFEQIFKFWVIGIVLGSVISVFGKQKIHQLFAAVRLPVYVSVCFIQTRIRIFLTFPVSGSR